MSMQRSRESTALHVDYYSTKKETANPVTPRERATMTRQATNACATPLIATHTRDLAKQDERQRGERASMQETSMAQGLFVV
jgi:hypothetical protein